MKIKIHENGIHATAQCSVIQLGVSLTHGTPAHFVITAYLDY